MVESSNYSLTNRERERVKWGYMGEVASGSEVKINPLVEKIGEKKLRAIAALGIAAAGFLGISGKPNTGVGAGIEVFNPTVNESVMAGVTVSSTEGEFPLGIPYAPGKYYKDIEAFSVNVGGAKFTVFAGRLEKNKYDSAKTLIGVYPRFETRLGRE